MSEGWRMDTGIDQQGESVYRSGFLHAWIDGFFQTLANGERIFYPQGAFGRRGYAIASTEQEMILRTNVRGVQRIYAGMLIVLILFFSGYMPTHTSWPILLIVIGSGPILWLLAKAYFWRFTRTMEPVAIPNSPVSCWRSMGRTINPLLLIGQTVFVGAISGVSLYSVYQNRDPVRLLLGMFVSTALVPYVIALRSWWQIRVSTKR